MIRCNDCGYLNKPHLDTCANCGGSLETTANLKMERSSGGIIPSGKDDSPIIPTTKEEDEDEYLARKVHVQTNEKLESETNFYTVINTIGSGGFGSVYLVEDSNKNQYALKVLHLWEQHPKMYKEIRFRFRREFQAGKIQSDYIVKSHDSGSIGGNPFIVMTYCEGKDLRKVINNKTKLSEKRVTGIATDILNGLHDLHRAGIIHRDLKPENVLFDGKGKALLSDFGISGFVNSRGTQIDTKGRVQRIIGTRIYMPPEQMDFYQAFRSMGPVTDIYSFGVMMYEVFTNGRLPFGDIADIRNNEVAYLNKVKTKQWTPIQTMRPDISRHWASIISKCLEPLPADRFQTAPEVLKELKQLRSSIMTAKDNSNNYRGALSLVVMNGDEIGRTYHLNNLLKGNKKNKKLLTLGWFDNRNPRENDLSITEKFTKYVSRFHATLEYEKNEWYIRDGQWRNINGVVQWKMSINGVLVNSKEVDKFGHKIKPDDIITVGDTTLRVEAK